MWSLVGETLSNHTQYKRKREEESKHSKLGGKETGMVYMSFRGWRRWQDRKN